MVLRRALDRFRRPQGNHHPGSSPIARPDRRIDHYTGHRFADELNREHPGWLVMWLTWQREFCAIAQWPVDKPLVITAATQKDLRRELLEAEMSLIRSGVLPPQYP
ncbi:hypothetical protein [Herbidospora sp. NBRC 101105]|uniref:hypothetical protein n=1 Tax=Herbidospora sp. NBRC 101105 TaxID=3032195 RepID=UPI0024A43B38|nr:hypothetical protein [Herbidospora sp. NBRC 101105]GLX95522.1 hypothetical protein Hesp01_34720 [Herbidospora sp. NBRC 101105]